MMKLNGRRLYWMTFDDTYFGSFFSTSSMRLTDSPPRLGKRSIKLLKSTTLFAS